MPSLQALIDAGLRELRLLDPLAAHAVAAPGWTPALAALTALRVAVVLAALTALSRL